MSVDYLSIAHETGRQLLDDATWSGSACHWRARSGGPGGPGPEETTGPHLYSGASGIGLFLLELWRQTQDPDVLRAVHGAATYVRGCDPGPPSGVGFFSGRLGIAYFFARLAAVLRSEQFATYARETLEPIVGEERRDMGFDVIAGSAGAIPALLNVAADVEWSHAQESLTAMADRVLNKAHRGITGWWWWPSTNVWEIRGLTGLGHGAAGYGYGLLELFAATGDNRYRYAAEQAFAYETSLFRPNEENWPDLRRMELYYELTAKGQDGLRKEVREGRAYHPSTAGSMTAWCHGAAGIGLTRMRAFELLGKQEYADQAKAAVRTTVRALAGEHQNASLCHGAFGNAETLLMAARVFGDTGLMHVVETAVEHCIDDRRRRGQRWRSGDAGGRGHPGLMLGAAGSGYFLLRLLSSDLPPVLLLTAPSGPREPTTRDATELDRYQDVHVDLHFGRTIRAFDRLMPQSRRLREAAAGKPLHRAIPTINEEVCRRLDAPHTPELTALLRDASSLDRARYEAAVAHDDFVAELWTTLRRPRVEEVAWRADAFVRPTAVTLVHCQFDWDAWLESEADALPVRLEEPIGFVVFRGIRNDIDFQRVNSFTMTILEILERPSTVDEVTTALLERVDTGSDSDATGEWRARIEAAIQSLLGKGLVDVVQGESHDAGRSAGASADSAGIGRPSPALS